MHNYFLSPGELRLNPLSQVQLVAIELPRSLLALVARQAPVRKYRRTVFRDAPNLRAISRMLFPCRFRTRISTAFSATSMRAPAATEYPMPGWVNFQPATRISFAPATTMQRGRFSSRCRYRSRHGFVKTGEAAILFQRQETAGGREYFGARGGMAS
jgi:hypothetical protein